MSEISKSIRSAYQEKLFEITENFSAISPSKLAAIITSKINTRLGFTLLEISNSFEDDPDVKVYPKCYIGFSIFYDYKSEFFICAEYKISNISTPCGDKVDVYKLNIALMNTILRQNIIDDIFKYWTKIPKIDDWLTNAAYGQKRKLSFENFDNKVHLTLEVITDERLKAKSSSEGLTIEDAFTLSYVELRKTMIFE